MLRRFRVRNFKGLRDVELQLGKLNVIVGPNGAGKSNLVDAFLLLKELVRPSSYPPYPFAAWGGYGRAVYMNDERLNVELGLEADEYSYRVVVNGAAGLQVLEEELEHGGHRLVKRGGEVELDGQRGSMPPSMSFFHLLPPAASGAVLLLATPVPVPQDLLNFMLRFGTDLVALRVNPQPRAVQPPTRAEARRLRPRQGPAAKPRQHSEAHNGAPRRVQHGVKRRRDAGGQPGAQVRRAR